MKGHIGWVVRAVLAAALLISLAAGCKETAAPKQATAPKAEKQAATKADQTCEGAKGSSGTCKTPATVADAKKKVTGEDPTQSIQGIQQLAEFLTQPDKSLANEAAQVLRDTLKTSKNSSVRVAAITTLQTKPNDFADILIEATGDADHTVRDAAIAALGRCAPGSPAEAKLHELTNSPDATVKGPAVRALTALRQGAGGNELVALASQLGNPDGDASAQAAISLKLRGPAALPVLENLVRTSPDARQRHAATMCVALICAGENPAQQRFAASVKSTKNSKSVVPQANLAGLPILSYAINDPDPMTREVAAQGLGYLGDPRAAAPLAKALKDPDTHVRRRAAAALITVPAKSVQRDLTDCALRDKDESVRRFAVEALGWIGDASVNPALVQAALDPSPDVRRYAAMQLGRARDEQALQALVKLFKDKDEDVRWASVQAVASMKDKRATQYLVAALDDPVPQVSNAAEAGLQKLGIAKRKLPGAD